MTNNALQTNRSHTAKIILAFAAIYVIWGTTYLGIHIAVETMPPFFMAGARFLFAGALIFIIMRLRGVEQVGSTLISVLERYARELHERGGKLGAGGGDLGVHLHATHIGHQ